MRVRHAWIAGSIVMLLTAAGCSLGPPYAQTAPPPMPAAPAEVRPAQPAPNYVWLPGYYTWRASDRAYVWVPGHWAVPPDGHVWVPGHWQTQSSGYTWVDGRWERRG
jgi:WXXGXW repeat (2 copies)